MITSDLSIGWESTINIGNYMVNEVLSSSPVHICIRTSRGEKDRGFPEDRSVNI